MPTRYMKVATTEDIKVVDVQINGQSVVDANKIAHIEVPEPEASVRDVEVDGISVVDPNDKKAKITRVLRTNDSEYPLAFEDESGNIAFVITADGHIKSKSFDSSNIHAGVEDVQEDGSSVVDENHVARITHPVKAEEGDPPFAIKDEQGNVVLQVDSNGHIQVKSFDSSTLDTIVQSVVSAMQGQGISILNNKINSNIIYREITPGGDSSPIVGAGKVGFMIIA